MPKGNLFLYDSPLYNRYDKNKLEINSKKQIKGGGVKYLENQEK